MCRQFLLAVTAEVSCAPTAIHVQTYSIDNIYLRTVYILSMLTVLQEQLDHGRTNVSTSSNHHYHSSSHVAVSGSYENVVSLYVLQCMQKQEFYPLAREAMCDHRL